MASTRELETARSEAKTEDALRRAVPCGSCGHPTLWVQVAGKFRHLVGFNLGPVRCTEAPIVAAPVPTPVRPIADAATVQPTLWSV